MADDLPSFGLGRDIATKNFFIEGVTRKEMDMSSIFST